MSSSENLRDIAILIPAYQAEATIAPVIQSVRDLGISVWVVDDASSDQTGRLAEEAGAQVIRRLVNGGKGAALRTGFSELLKIPTVEWILMMDADHQHLPEEIPLFLEARRNNPQAHFFIGNRMHSPEGMPRDRRWTNRFLSGLLSFWTGHPVPDSQCGFRMVSRRVLENIRLNSSRFEIESELIIRSARAGFLPVSIPIRSVYPKRRISFVRPFQDTLRFVRFAVLVWVEREKE